jgi:hypothetical protein
MVEEPLVESLMLYIESGNRNERQLANLAKDLIDLAGDDPRVVKYLNMKAGAVMEDERAWD